MRYYRTLLFLAISLCGFFSLVHNAASQARDLRAERLVIDDDGADGTQNTMTIQTGDSLAQNVVIIIPDMGSDSAEFLLLPYGSAGAWLLNGNAETTPGVNYIGTSDVTALHLYVNGGGSNALILNTNGSIQHSTGGNARGANGVDFQSARTAANQVANGDYAVIAGGLSNLASGTKSAVSGGEGNAIRSDYGATGGGYQNKIDSNASYSAIGGGYQNNLDTSASYSAIGGGQSNHILDDHSAIGGGLNNEIGSIYGAIGGGQNNAIQDHNSVIGGGQSNQILDDHGVIGGGQSNEIQSDYGTIGGGRENFIETGRRRATIAGGFQNQIITSGESGTIGGGRNNIVSGERGTVGGGQSNMSLSDYSTVSGGRDNNITGNGSFKTVAGGSSNQIVGTLSGSTIGGGVSNTITKSASVIPGGRGLTLNGDGSFGFLSNQFGSLNMTVSADKVVLFGNTDLWLANNDGAARRLLFYEANSDTGTFPTSTTYYTSLQAGDQSEDITYTLPTAAPISNGQVLSSDTNGVMSWEDLSEPAWSLTGNAGTTPGTNYVGTSDATALHLYVNGGTSALILNTNGSIQHSTGGNARGASAIDLQHQRNGNDANVASGNYSTLSGGFGNIASGAEATVSGGQNNAASGVHATVGGGLSNTGSGDYTTVGGGRKNTTNGIYSSIPGGANLTLAGGGSFGFLADSTFALPMTVTAGNTAVFGNTNLWLANNSGAASQLRFYEANSTTGVFPPSTTYYTSFEAGDQSEDITYTLPAVAPGANGQVLSSDTNGLMSWANASGTGWSLTGNAGTTPGTNYVGTSDSTALHLYVNGGASSALILNTNGSIQHDTGGIARGRGAVDMQSERNSNDTNVASANYSTLSGGYGNRVSATFATISGGWGNLASTSYATVSGGRNSIASGFYSTVGGGLDNLASNFYSTVGGGHGDSATGMFATVGGGEANRADGLGTTIGGGQLNNASGTSATISGGQSNTVSGNHTTVGGGFNNIASSNGATIAGGTSDSANGSQSTIGGGINNLVNGNFATIGGGAYNTVNGLGSVIPGGARLTLAGGGSFGFLADSTFSFSMTVTEGNTALFGNSDLWLANNDGAASRLRFYEANSSTGAFPTATTYYTSFEAGDQSEDIHYTLPASAPASNGQVLTSDTNGVMSWTAGPTGAQSFANASNTTSTLALENNAGTDDGIALEIVEGRVVLSNGQGAPTNIPDDVVAFEINDATASSAPTVGLPASGANGQILYLLVSDPDGATVGGAARASGDKLTYLYLGGAWQLFHLN